MSGFLNPGLIGGVVAGIIGLIGVIASVVQIVQYIEQRIEKKRTRAAVSMSRHELPLSPSFPILAPRTNSSIPLSIPTNLPTEGVFVGRDDKQEELYSAILSDARIVAVEGVGGIGKTALTLRVAHRLYDEASGTLHLGRFASSSFSAFIWLTAKANPLTLNNILDSIARLLDYPYISQLDASEKQIEVLGLLRQMKVLLIIDNFETITDSAVGQFVEDVPEPSKVVITSRKQQIWNVLFVPIAVGKLSTDEALEIVKREATRLGLNRLMQTPQELLVSLIFVTGGSPLAIKWSVGQMKQRGQTISSVLDALHDARGEIFETLFARSWNLLSEPSKQILLAAPLFSSSVARAALAAATGLEGSVFSESLGQLVELWLIESNNEPLSEHQRFSLHPLTRSFVLSKLALFPDFVRIVRLRTIQFYLDFCDARRYLQHGRQGYEEIESELPNILPLFDWLTNSPLSDDDAQSVKTQIVRFADSLNVFCWSRGYWGERVTLCEHAVEASTSLEDWAAAGRHATFIGIVYIWQGAADEAKRWADQSLIYMGRTGKPLSLALAKRLQGLVLMIQRNYTGASSALEDVLDQIAPALAVASEEVRIFADWVCPGRDGFKTGAVAVKQELGIISNRAEQFDTALRWLEDSRQLAESIGDVEGLSVSYSHLGTALLAIGRISEAEVAFRKGLELATEVQRKSTMGRCYEGLAAVATAQNRREEVFSFGSEAINLFERLGMQQERKHVLALLDTVKNG